MRKIRYAVLGLIGVALIVIALANRQIVTLRLLPEEMAGLFGFSWEISLPLFLIVLVSVGIGIAIGEIFEWVREHKHRAEARTIRRENEKLQRAVKGDAPATRADKGDDVLAILDGR